jgi:hypothetical protein
MVRRHHSLRRRCVHGQPKDFGSECRSRFRSRSRLDAAARVDRRQRHDELENRLGAAPVVRPERRCRVYRQEREGADSSLLVQLHFQRYRKK